MQDAPEPTLLVVFPGCEKAFPSVLACAELRRQALRHRRTAASAFRAIESLYRLDPAPRSQIHLRPEGHAP
jgi:hypothetical protein